MLGNTPACRHVLPIERPHWGEPAVWSGPHGSSPECSHLPNLSVPSYPGSAGLDHARTAKRT